MHTYAYPGVRDRKYFVGYDTPHKNSFFQPDKIIGNNCVIDYIFIRE